ncbi:MAG: transporter substrate-binding domain-containing protein [Synechococcales cyanobacterium RM1_1_8]|nr:transporter substrate-binding domain-containing protein [Synechococcales cyanobacterium RM1_1_8]
MALITDQPGLNRLAAWQDQRLGVLADSTAIAVVRSRLPRLTLVPYASYQAALAGLRQGEADGFAGDATVLAGWVQAHPAYAVVGPRLSTEPLAVALPKGLQHESLRRAIEQSLTQGQRSGWLGQQARRWGLF